MYWLAVPALFGLNAPWAPCAPSPIMPSPNSTIVWSIAPSARTPRAVGISRNPNARSRNESAAPMFCTEAGNDRRSSHGLDLLPDRRHERCLSPVERRRLERGLAPQLPHQVHRLHRDLSLFFPPGSSSSRSCARARLSRERTVPIGSSSASATLWYERSSHAKSRSASRSPSGSASIASATRGKSTRASRAPALARLSVASSSRHPGARAQPPGLAAPVLQQQIRADPVQPRQRARARHVERLAPLERDPEQLADQPLRDFGAHPAAQEAEQGGGMAVVDQPEGLGLVQRAADHLGVRRRAHRLLFPDRGVWFAGDDYRHAGRSTPVHYAK